MKHFFIGKLSDNEIEEQKVKYGNTGYVDGHIKEHALQKHFDKDYVFNKDSRPFHTYSDIKEKNASVKSANCTLFVNGKVVNKDTPVSQAIEYYLTNCISTTYYIVLEPTKWCKDIQENQYVVVEMNKKEMYQLLIEYACTDRDSKLKNGKNCLRLKRTDDVVYKWYLMNR